MLGIKARIFAPIVNVSLEDLVPAGHFYRHVEHKLDLSFVRDLVQSCYAAGGRPSVDPVVFFKLQLIMFFEGIRSERQLIEVAADRLSLRWFLGYDLHEKLPDHSSLSKIRDRYGVTLFRRFFDQIVEQLSPENCAVTADPLAASRQPCEPFAMDLRDLLEPDRHTCLDDDLDSIERTLGALPKLSSRWELLPVSKRAEYIERWHERMLILESLPARLYRCRPTLLQRARYCRIVDQVRDQQGVIEGLGLHFPRLP